jgi:hypothetical protein
MKYVVSSPSRTGSTLLCTILQSAGITNILHTHNCFFTVQEPKSTVLLFSYRRDLFRSIMSCLIGKRTQTYQLYASSIPTPTIESFNIDCIDLDSEFQKQYRWHKWYIQSHDLSKPYHRVETIYLEDFVSDYNYVFDKLGLTKQQEITPTIETPYKYTEVISNHTECREVFDQLELTSKFVPILKAYDPSLPN